MLPRAVTFKGGRQAGCKKISNVVYPEGSVFARRSKSIAWRASVEMSKTVAQLIFQIKELDSNIRWPELLKPQSYLQLANESKSLARLFKKVIIRKKCTDGAAVRYLLDFGKRQNFPHIVTKYGILLEEPSSERKKFWLSENHVPLNLLRSFEEKRLTRLLKKGDSKLLPEMVSNCNMKKAKKSKGLSYLILKAEKMESEVCQHCNKDVLIREAVNCQFCKGFFHRSHFRVYKGGVAGVYTCYRCKDKESIKTKPPGKKVVSKKKKNSSYKKLKPLPNIRNGILVKGKKKPNGKKKNKHCKTKKNQSRQSENSISGHKRKRTTLHFSFWLNGLLWSRKPDDDRGKCFRKRKVFLPSQKLENISVQPVCCLCHKEYSSQVIYISCEICEDWFHGAVYSLTLENINNLIGFKCHNCRATSAPSCPFSQRSSLLEPVTSKHKKGEEILLDGTYQGPHARVSYHHKLDQQGEDYVGTNDDLTLNFNRNVLYNVQSYEPQEESQIFQAS